MTSEILVGDHGLSAACGAAGFGAEATLLSFGLAACGSEGTAGDDGCVPSSRTSIIVSVSDSTGAAVTIYAQTATITLA